MQRAKDYLVRGFVLVESRGKDVWVEETEGDFLRINKFNMFTDATDHRNYVCVQAKTFIPKKENAVQHSFG